MTKRRYLSSVRRLAPGALGACLLGLLVLAATSPALAKPKPRGIRGKVLSAPADGLVPGAVITAVHLESGKSFRSGPSDLDGRFILSDMPYGYYEFAVDTGDTLYAIAGIALLEPGKDQKFDLRLLPANAAGGTVPVTIAGLGREATAGGEIVGLSFEPPFYKTPAGVASIVGASALFLLLL